MTDSTRTPGINEAEANVSQAQRDHNEAQESKSTLQYTATTPSVSGTAATPFRATNETETNARISFQSISFQQPYQKYSFEELRVADYEAGRRFTNILHPLLTGTSGQLASFGASCESQGRPAAGIFSGLEQRSGSLFDKAAPTSQACVFEKRAPAARDSLFSNHPTGPKGSFFSDHGRTTQNSGSGSLFGNLHSESVPQSNLFDRSRIRGGFLDGQGQVTRGLFDGQEGSQGSLFGSGGIFNQNVQPFPAGDHGELFQSTPCALTVGKDTTQKLFLVHESLLRQIPIFRSAAIPIKDEGGKLKSGTSDIRFFDLDPIHVGTLLTFLYTGACLGLRPQDPHGVNDFAFLADLYALAHQWEYKALKDAILAKLARSRYDPAKDFAPFFQAAQKLYGTDALCDELRRLVVEKASSIFRCSELADPMNLFGVDARRRTLKVKMKDISMWIAGGGPLAVDLCRAMHTVLESVANHSCPTSGV